VQANEEPTDDDMNITLEALSGMIDSWSNDSLLIYTMNPYTFNTVAGVQTYTLGPGGVWDIERPMKIAQANIHYTAAGSQPVDMPIALANDAQWASISVKSIQTSIPIVLYDNGNYPLRTIYIYPVPSQAQVLNLWLWQPLLNFVDLDEEVSFPPGYERAIRYCLAIEVSPEFGKNVSEPIISIAVSSKAELKSMNAVTQVQSFDKGVSSNTGTQFNWITGNFIPFR